MNALARQARQNCPNCGQPVPPLDGYCASCGQPALVMGGAQRLAAALLPAATFFGGLLFVGRFAGALQAAATGPAAELVRLLAGRWGVVTVTGGLLLLVTLGLETWAAASGALPGDRRYSLAAALLLALLSAVYLLCWTVLWSGALFPLAVQYGCAGYALGMQTGRLPSSGRSWHLPDLPLTAAGTGAGYLAGLAISGYGLQAAALLLGSALLGAGGAAALYLPAPAWLLDSNAGLQMEARLRWLKGHRAWLLALLFAALAYFTFG